MISVGGERRFPILGKDLIDSPGVALYVSSVSLDTDNLAGRHTKYDRQCAKEMTSDERPEGVQYNRSTDIGRKSSDRTN